jgi:hypothetical protein
MTFTLTIIVPTVLLCAPFALFDFVFSSLGLEAGTSEKQSGHPGKRTANLPRPETLTLIDVAGEKDGSESAVGSEMSKQSKSKSSHIFNGFSQNSRTVGLTE